MIGRLLRTSLAARMAAAVFTLGFTAVALAAALSYTAAETALRENTADVLATYADDDVRYLDRWLRRQQDALQLMATAIEVPGGARLFGAGIGIQRLPASVLAAERYRLIAVPGGRIVRASDTTEVGSFAVDELYYQRGQAGPFVQPLHPAGVDSRPTLTISAPVRRGGALIAVLAANLSIAEIEDVLRGRTSRLDVDVYFVDRFAQYVSAERFGTPGARRGIRSVGVDDVIRGRNGEGIYQSHDGREVMGAWRWVPDLQIGIVMEADAARALAPARRLWWLTLLVGTLATILLALGAIVVTRRFTSPVNQVAAAAAAVAAGELDTRAPVRGTDELSSLARAFNEMTSRLQRLDSERAAQIQATEGAFAEAQATRALLEDVVNNSTTVMLVVDLEGQILLGNTRFAELVGFTPGQRVAGSLTSAVSETRAGALAHLIARAERGGTVVEEELELGSPDGTHAWQAVAFPLVRADGTRYATGLIATDLTERARAEAQRRERDASVQQAQKLESLGVMAGGIAHDFNNLLAAIMGNVDVARDAIDDREEVTISLDHIAAASRRAAELTRQMLAYAGRASLRRETVDARKVLADIVPLVRAAQPKKVEFVTFPAPQPLWVEVDPAQLSQVVLNLLTNAAEAIGDQNGTVTLSAEYLTAPRIDGGDAAWVHIVVEDTGAGMSADVLARIFDPFFTTKMMGRGLGLSAVRGIVNSLGGRLDVQSAPGKGTRFEVFLPAGLAPEEGASTSGAAPRVTTQGTVLVVDDEESLRRLARRALESMGQTVVEAADGVNGLRRFHEHANALTLVVLDLTMPGMGGAELLREIRRTHPTLRAIIASGYDLADALSAAPRDRYTTFLQKPFGIRALQAAVAEALA